jgi:hypothetical protein
VFIVEAFDILPVVLSAGQRNDHRTTSFLVDLNGQHRAP